MSKKRYQVVTEDCISNLENRVNELWSEGWQPVGGIAGVTKIYSAGAGRMRYAQALVLPETCCTTACAFDEEVNLMFAGSAS